MNKSGFMLLEAILTVVIVSICLTFIAQGLLTNFRTGARFQEMSRALFVMENRMGLLYAANASDDQLSLYPQALDEPYAQFKISTRVDAINEHLKLIDLKLNWPRGRGQGQMDATTIIYFPDEK